MAQYPMYNYGAPYGGYQQPIMNYQPMDRMPQIQQNYAQTVPNQYQQPQMAQQPMMGLNGEFVDSVDVVNARNVDMSGNPTFYPKSDLSEIYIKKLQSDGKSKVMIYKLVQDSMLEPVQQPVISPDILNEMFGQLRQDLLSEINGIKEMIPALFGTSDPQKSTRGGGSQK